MICLCHCLIGKIQNLHEALSRKGYISKFGGFVHSVWKFFLVKLNLCVFIGSTRSVSTFSPILRSHHSHSYHPGWKGWNFWPNLKHCKTLLNCTCMTGWNGLPPFPIWKVVTVNPMNLPMCSSFFFVEYVDDSNFFRVSFFGWGCEKQFITIPTWAVKKWFGVLYKRLKIIGITISCQYLLINQPVSWKMTKVFFTVHTFITIMISCCSFICCQFCRCICCGRVTSL